MTEICLSDRAPVQADYFAVGLTSEAVFFRFCLIAVASILSRVISI